MYVTPWYLRIFAFGFRAHSLKYPLLTFSKDSSPLNKSKSDENTNLWTLKSIGRKFVKRKCYFVYVFERTNLIGCWRFSCCQLRKWLHVDYWARSIPPTLVYSEGFKFVTTNQVASIRKTAILLVKGVESLSQQFGMKINKAYKLWKLLKS